MKQEVTIYVVECDGKYHYGGYNYSTSDNIHDAKHYSCERSAKAGLTYWKRSCSYYRKELDLTNARIMPVKVTYEA